MLNCLVTVFQYGIVHLFNGLKGRVVLSVRWLAAFNGDPASPAHDNTLYSYLQANDDSNQEPGLKLNVTIPWKGLSKGQRVELPFRGYLQDLRKRIWFCTITKSALWISFGKQTPCHPNFRILHSVTVLLKQESCQEPAITINICLFFPLEDWLSAMELGSRCWKQMCHGSWMTADTDAQQKNGPL